MNFFGNLCWYPLVYDGACHPFWQALPYSGFVAPHTVSVPLELSTTTTIPPQSPCLIQNLPKIQVIPEDLLDCNLKDKDTTLKIRGTKKPKKTQKPEQKNEIKYKFPSVIMKVLTFICKPNSSFQLCKRIVTSLVNQSKPEWTAEKYYTFFGLVRTRLARHENIKTLLNLNAARQDLMGLFGKEEQLFYMKVARIMVQHYLKEEMVACILVSTKISPNNRMEHLQIRRELIRVLNPKD